MKIDKSLLSKWLKYRENDSHKGDFGHALLVCGCERMPGAAVLATGSALNSGCGLVTLRSTRTACTAAMAAFPSAMLSTDPGEFITALPEEDLLKFSAVGVGPGIGKAPGTTAALHRLLEGAAEKGISMVLDADALNIISEHREFLDLIPAESVLTPHLGELRRLVGKNSPSEDDITELCRRTCSAIVVKGPATRVYVHTGEVYVNTTGNPGLAKGGSGDVLAGLITGLMARGYKWFEAAALGVWLHGYAGDCLTAERTAECYSSRDLIDQLYKAFVELYK